MEILALYITLDAPFVHSLKEKRAIVKSLVQRIRNNWPVCVMELDKQDVWQTVVLGIAIAAHNRKQADQIADQLIDMVEQHNDAAVRLIEREWR